MGGGYGIQVAATSSVDVARQLGKRKIKRHLNSSVYSRKYIFLSVVIFYFFHAISLYRFGVK